MNGFQCPRFHISHCSRIIFCGNILCQPCAEIEEPSLQTTALIGFLSFTENSDSSPQSRTLSKPMDLSWDSNIKYCLSVQFSCSVVTDSLRPHESQHARPPCPSPSPRVHSDSHPLSPWCHPATSSSVAPFSSCPQSLPASEFFQWVNSSHEVAKVLEFQL